MTGYTSNRRRMWREDSIEDEWAAAEEDDVYDDAVEIEDLAAGYVDDPVDPLPPPATRLSARRARLTRMARDDGNSPGRIPKSLHQTNRWVVEPWNDELERSHPPRRVRPRKRRREPTSGPWSSIPVWAIALIVVLVLIAVLVGTLAIAMVLSVL